MAKTVGCRVARASRTASMVLVLAVVLAGCAGTDADSGPQEKQADAASDASPRANDDNATTSEEREVLIEMVANDSGRSLQIDEVQPGRAHGDIICDAEIETGKIVSCAYTPVEGFTGKDEFSYVVKDANGKTDSATVYVKVEPLD